MALVVELMLVKASKALIAAFIVSMASAKSPLEYCAWPRARSALASGVASHVAGASFQSTDSAAALTTCAWHFSLALCTAVFWPSAFLLGKDHKRITPTKRTTLPSWGLEGLLPSKNRAILRVYVGWGLMVVTKPFSPEFLLLVLPALVDALSSLAWFLQRLATHCPKHRIQVLNPTDRAPWHFHPLQPFHPFVVFCFISFFHDLSVAWCCMPTSNIYEYLVYLQYLQ